MDRARAFLTSRVAILAAAVVAAACTSRPEPAAPRGLGKAVATGPVRAVAPSADGAWVAVLVGCADVAVPSLPPNTASCALRVAPAGGGEVVSLAGAVTTLPQGLLWSRSGATLAALSEYDYPSASGTLVLWRPGAAPRAVADRVTFFGFGEGGDLGYVSGGRFGLVRADGTERAPSPPGDVATFELGGRGAAAQAGSCAECPAPALVRRTGASGGALVDPCCGANVLALGVTEYGFSPGGARIAWVTVGRDGSGLWAQDVGARAATRIASGAQSFAWDRRGEALAFVSDLEPGKQGDLHVWAGRKDTPVLAREVGEFRWAARAPRLVWVEKYDPRVRAGTVGAGGAGDGLSPRTFADHVTDAAISADGKHVAFLRHTTRGGYTIDLGLAHLDAPPPPAFGVVASGVFGFAFSPDGAWLYYQTRCTGEAADACDVERIPAGGLTPGAKPEQVVQGAAGFEFAPDDPERLLVTWRSGPRGSAVDVGVWDEGRLTRVDGRVRAGTARFAGPGSKRVVYAVADEARAGAYVAEVP